MGVGFDLETARWRCPDGVAILRVADLKLSLPLGIVWRRDNLSPLLSRFVTDVRSLARPRQTTPHTRPANEPSSSGSINLWSPRDPMAEARGSEHRLRSRP